MMDPLVGTMVGEYQVQAKLGAGGMGVVYEGLQQQIGKRVAIKVLQGEAGRQLDDGDKLLAEARAANAIHHRGIVDVFSFGVLGDGRHYFVMELLEGKPLDEIITKEAPMAPREILPILIEILEALSAAHHVGVIHRDIKPSNVFVVTPAHGSRYTKLLDFGLAKLLAVNEGTAAAASTMVGTIGYIAPEQALGQRIGPHSDIYSFGCVIFEMLTGRLPFEAATPFEVVDRHVNAPPPRVRQLVPSVPAELDQLVWEMMQKDPASRPESADVVRKRLVQISKRLSDAHAMAATEPPHPSHGIELAPPVPMMDSGMDPGLDAGAIPFEAPVPWSEPVEVDDSAPPVGMRPAVTAQPVMQAPAPVVQVAPVAARPVQTSVGARKAMTPPPVADAAARKPAPVEDDEPVSSGGKLVPIAVILVLVLAVAAAIHWWPSRRRAKPTDAPGPSPVESVAQPPVAQPARPAAGQAPDEASVPPPVVPKIVPIAAPAAHPPTERTKPVPPPPVVSQPKRPAEEKSASGTLSKGQLLKTIDILEHELEQKKSQGIEVPPLAVGFLKALRTKAMEADDPESCRKVANDLAGWQRKFRQSQ